MKHEADDETVWREEFARYGERAIRDALRGASMYPEPKRQAAFRWLGEQESKHAFKEEQMYRYVRWTLWAAVGAVIVSVIGVLVTLLR
jgi:hypothetical protein